MRAELGAMRGGALWAEREAWPEPLDDAYRALLERDDALRRRSERSTTPRSASARSSSNAALGTPARRDHRSLRRRGGALGRSRRRHGRRSRRLLHVTRLHRCRRPRAARATGPPRTSSRRTASPRAHWSCITCSTSPSRDRPRSRGRRGLRARRRAAARTPGARARRRGSGRSPAVAWRWARPCTKRSCARPTRRPRSKSSWTVPRVGRAHRRVGRGGGAEEPYHFVILDFRVTALDPEQPASGRRRCRGGRVGAARRALGDAPGRRALRIPPRHERAPDADRQPPPRRRGLLVRPAARRAPRHDRGDRARPACRRRAQPQTEWDTETGFASAAEAVLARREEDAGAMRGGRSRARPTRAARRPVRATRRARRPSPRRARRGDRRARIGPDPRAPRDPPSRPHPGRRTDARAIAASLGAPIVVYEELPYRVEEPDEHAAALGRASPRKAGRSNPAA